MVLAGGTGPVRIGALGPPWDEPALVVAADSGLHLAPDLGLRVDLVVGDLDSADAAALAAAEAAGARVERHPAAKDETDLELALAAAAAHGCTDVLVLGITGGRLDHLLANVLLLAAARFAHLRIDAVADDARVTVVHDARTLHGTPGSVVSLLAVGGPARGVRTRGLVYPLAGDTLLPGSSRGVSNVFAEPDATVALDDGTLLAVQPVCEQEVR